MDGGRVADGWRKDTVPHNANGIEQKSLESRPGLGLVPSSCTLFLGWMAEVAEGWRICGQVGNLSAIFTKRARNVDEGQEKERYITNIESARKEFHTGCTLQIHSF